MCICFGKQSDSPVLPTLNTESLYDSYTQVLQSRKSLALLHQESQTRIFIIASFSYSKKYKTQHNPNDNQ